MAKFRSRTKNSERTVQTGDHNPYPCDISEASCRNALGVAKRGIANSHYPCDIENPRCRAVLGLRMPFEKRGSYTIQRARGNNFPCDIKEWGCRQALGLRKRGAKWSLKRAAQVAEKRGKNHQRWSHAEKRFLSGARAFQKRDLFMKRANSPIMVIDEGFRPGQMELPDFDDFRNSYNKKNYEYDEMADGNVSDGFYDSDEGSENFQKEIHHEGHEHRHSMNSNPKRGIFKKIYTGCFP